MVSKYKGEVRLLNITIAGAGYVGLVTGVCLSSKGQNITIIDIDKDKIETLRGGNPPFYEDRLSEMIKENHVNMTFTTDPAEAYTNADAVMLAVATPEKRDGSANLTYLYDACSQILQHSRDGCLVIVKSTVPVGTCDKMQQFFLKRRPGCFQIASNPEFLAQGSAVMDTLFPSRIVIGTEDASAAEIVQEIFRDFDCVFVMTDRRSAEMIKYASNDFLALKISYINEIANLCEIVGADVDMVSFGMGLDPRIGEKYLRAGTGYGGSCFPKDTKALHWLARYYDYELRTIKAAIEVNENQKMRLFKKAKRYYKSLGGLTVAVLGLAFKPGTDDLREAPSVDVIQLLSEEGAIIKAWDPVAAENFDKQYPGLITNCPTIDSAINNADICLIFTEWDEIKAYSPKRFATLMRNSIVIDGRNCFETADFANSGVIYDSVGRNTMGCEFLGLAKPESYAVSVA